MFLALDLGRARLLPLLEILEKTGKNLEGTFLIKNQLFH